MNNQKSFTAFLSTLAASFPGEVSQPRLEIYLKILTPHLVETNLRELLEKLIINCRFFPTVAEIMETAGGRKQTHRQLASDFVDTMTALFFSNCNVYETAGAANYKFWKDTIGIMKFDFQNIDPKFHRGEWIDKIERAYDRAASTKDLPALESAPSIAEKDVRVSLPEALKANPFLQKILKQTATEPKE